MLKKVPFLPFEIRRVKRFSRIFKPIAMKISFLLPSLKSDLTQLEADVTPTEYVSIGIISAIYSFSLVFFSLFLVIFVLMPSQLPSVFLILLGSSIVFSFFIFLQTLFYPSVVLKRKANDLNKDILFALRHLLIQIRSGVLLYNAIISVSQAGYGVVSKEFEIVAKEINGGTPQTEALDNMVLRTPSSYLRRAVWQIANALRAGSDLANTIETLVKEFSEEERVRLQRFSKELSPWALMYLMLTVIFPTMGIAMLLVLSTLAPINLNESMFFIFTIFFAAFQFFFVKFLKNKRPMLRV